MPGNAMLRDCVARMSIPAQDGRSRCAFVSAVVSLVAGFAAVGSTIPIFKVFRAQDGFTKAGISVTVVVYSAVTLGAIASETLVQFGPWPRDIMYLILVGILFLSIVLTRVSPGTVVRQPGGWRSTWPTVRVPRRVRRLSNIRLGPVKGELHTSSSLVLGSIFAAYMTLSTVGAPLGRRLALRAAQRVGIAALLLGMIGGVLAIASDELALLIVSTVVASIAQGIPISAVTRSLLHGGFSEDRGTGLQRDLFALLRRREHPGTHRRSALHLHPASVTCPRVRSIRPRRNRQCHGQCPKPVIQRARGHRGTTSTAPVAS
jgi:hypothetical protein